MEVEIQKVHLFPYGVSDHLDIPSFPACIIGSIEDEPRYPRYVISSFDGYS